MNDSGEQIIKKLRVKKMMDVDFPSLLRVQRRQREKECNGVNVLTV